MTTAQEKSQETNAIRREIAKQDAIQKNLAPCDRCGQKCFWAKTARGKSILLDLEVRKEGEYEVTPTLSALVATRLNAFDKSLWKQQHNGHDFLGHECHFDTCSEGESKTVAEAHRRRVRAEERAKQRHPAGGVADLMADIDDDGGDSEMLL